MPTLNWAIEHAQELTGFDADNAVQKFQASFPFHLSVLSVFERKWQSIPRFQRTRRVLRMLALWVTRNYQEEHRKDSREPLITLGTAPLDDPIFRAAMFEQLGSDQLEVPVTTDILGKGDAHALRLDKEATEAIKKAQLHRKIATVIFFESNGGMSQARSEATLPEIKAGVGGPGVNLVDTDHALEGLASSCFYLNWERNRYRFGLSPNLNQILVTRRRAVRDKDISDRINKEIQKLFDKNTTDACKQLDRKYFPTRSNDVPSRAMLTLVVLDTEHQASDRKVKDLMESIIQNCGSTGRTYKSAVIFSAPDAIEPVREAARNLLAWEDIDDDENTKKRIDDGQVKLLGRNLGNARRDLSEALFRVYRHVCLLGKDNKLRHIDLGQITSNSAGSIVELILRELERNDEITTGVSPTKLVKYWPPALVEWSTKTVRDAFYSSPQLPRLINADAIKRTICDGVSQGVIGYASKDAKGQLKLEKLKESLFDADVDISDDMFILKEADAQKLLEPPRLAQLVIRPDHVNLAAGEQAAFSCTALDQYGQPFTLPAITWSATGGTITDAGQYTAGDTGGLHSVKSQAGGLEAIAEVRVRTADEKDDRDDNDRDPGKRTLRWRGTIPPKKWMNFYTKVLTRFASMPDLKLEISFEVDQAQTKANETRTGLKELGLDDDVACE